MNFLSILALASQIASAAAQLAAGQPITFKTYLGKQHVQVTVQELS